MAISSLYPRKTMRNRRRFMADRLDYDQKAEKTIGGDLVSSYMCLPESAAEEFEASKKLYFLTTGRRQDPAHDILMYRIIQSFKPGEITPEEANRLGYELAMKFTKGQHQFVVSTHVDKAHIHTHIEFNSTNLNCDGKFQNVKDSAFILRELNDNLCRSHGYSVIENPKPSAKKQKELAAAQYGSSHKEQLRQAIDRVLPNSRDYEDFLAKMRAEGYEVKEGGILQPDFETVHVTVDGKEGAVLKHSFFNNWHITDEERTYANDDTPIRARKDGTLVERYQNDDGSMEYIISVMKNFEESSLIGKKVHVELQNLGTYVRYSSAYRTDVEAVWSFDFTLEGADQVRSAVMSQPLGDSGITVTKVELSPISFYVEYDYCPQLTMKDAKGTWTIGTVPPLVGVRLKDGTLITGAMGGASEGYVDDAGRYIYYGTINRIIDPQEVDTLLFFKSAVYEERTSFIEEDYYYLAF